MHIGAESCPYIVITSVADISITIQERNVFDGDDDNGYTMAVRGTLIISLMSTQYMNTCIIKYIIFYLTFL